MSKLPIENHKVPGTCIKESVDRVEHAPDGYGYHLVTQEGKRKNGVGPILLQHGIKPSVERNGWLTNEILSLLIDHLNFMNQGEYRNRETSVAVTHLETAMLWINKRTADRIARKVYGEEKP